MEPTPGVFDAGDTYIKTETTDADGYYRFDDLGGDDYVVVVPGDNFDAGNPLAGYLSSGATIAADGTITDSIGPDPDDDADNDDNGTPTVTSGTVDYVSAQAITLGPDQSEPTDDDDPTTNPKVARRPTTRATAQSILVSIARSWATRSSLMWTKTATMMTRSTNRLKGPRSNSIPAMAPNSRLALMAS